MNTSIKEIGLIASVSLVLLTIWIYIYNDAIISHFIMENGNALWAFLFSFALLLFITGLLYQRTLDFLDEVTPLTVNRTILNIVLWCLFWISWCVYNVKILFNYSFGNKLFIFSFLLTTIPGVSFFIYAIWSRNDELKARRNGDVDIRVSDENFETDQKLLKITYFIGFYGIFTIPVYLLTYVIFLLIE
jgi:hypothetical protein